MVVESVAGDRCDPWEFQPSAQGRTRPRKPGLESTRAAPASHWLSSWERTFLVLLSYQVSRDAGAASGSVAPGL